jgi:hypothetical protein
MIKEEIRKETCGGDVYQVSQGAACGPEESLSTRATSTPSPKKQTHLIVHKNQERRYDHNQPVHFECRKLKRQRLAASSRCNIPAGIAGHENTGAACEALLNITHKQDCPLRTKLITSSCLSRKLSKPKTSFKIEILSS